MRGPPPKDRAVRQRQNKFSTRAMLTAPARERTRAPRLPERAEGWHPLTQRYWSEIWHSPMADEYLAADVGGLLMLALLVNEFWDRPTPALSAEIRLRGQAFGLSPIDRRRLEWSVKRAETPRPDAKPPAVRPENDPRNILRDNGRH